MEANLPTKAVFPYSNWGPRIAVIGVLLAICAGIVLAVPVLIAAQPHDGKLPAGANVAVQLATALGFALVPIAIAIWRGADFRQALRRLGVRRPGGRAVRASLLACAAYLAFGWLYVALFGAPHQKDIAEDFGALPLQILLIVVAAPVSEEICFRGMLFGGLRERLPRLGAAALSAAIFGGLHATTGISAVPPLIFFGFILALLYERTGSVIPGILLHMLNNSVALLGQ